MRFPPVFLAVILLFLSACAPERRIEPDNLFWPPPPSQPRIKYIQSIYTEDDIGREYTFMEKLFGKGYDDSLSRPYGVFARHGRMYAGDIELSRVIVFDLASKRLHATGEEGALRTPAGVVADAAGRLYVADTAGAKVSVYDQLGNYATAVPLGRGWPVVIALDEARGRLLVRGLTPAVRIHPRPIAAAVAPRVRPAPRCRR